MTIQIVKGLHILAVIAWMAGLLYLPRLFVYHTQNKGEPTTARTLTVMERRLYRGIMNPAMIAVLLLGATLVWLEGVQILHAPWMVVKLIGVLFLIGVHHFMGRARKRMAEGIFDRSERFWRLLNETPFVAAAIIVLSVTTKYGG